MVKDKESQATCELLLFDGVDCDEGVNDEKFYCNATALLKNKNEGALRCQTVKMRSTKTIYVKARTQHSQDKENRSKQELKRQLAKLQDSPTPIIKHDNVHRLHKLKTQQCEYRALSKTTKMCQTPKRSGGTLMDFAYLAQEDQYLKSLIKCKMIQKMKLSAQQKQRQKQRQKYKQIQKERDIQRQKERTREKEKERQRQKQRQRERQRQRQRQLQNQLERDKHREKVKEQNKKQIRTLRQLQRINARRSIQYREYAKLDQNIKAANPESKQSTRSKTIDRRRSRITLRAIFL